MTSSGYRYGQLRHSVKLQQISIKTEVSKSLELIILTKLKIKFIGQERLIDFVELVNKPESFYKNIIQK